MTAADLFVKALENEGVEYIFGVPGEENLDFLEALRQSKIKFIVTRHEQAAGFMAATVGRLTGRPGVALSTLGPGATNLATAAAYANLGGFPLVLITGQKSIRRNKQGLFQIIATTEIFKPITKFAEQIKNADETGKLVRKAFAIATRERPGAALLELPEDVAREETQGGIVMVEKSKPQKIDEVAFATAVEMIRSAKSPLILIGGAANRNNLSRELKALIDKTKIPFFVTQMGKGAIPEDHKLYLGTAAVTGQDYLHCVVAKADLFISVGHDVLEKPPFLPAASQKILHLNYFSSSFPEIYQPSHEVTGDLANILEKLTKELQNQDWDFTYFQKVKELIHSKTSEKSDSNSFPILPQRLVADVRAVMPRDGIVAMDNGMYKLWFTRNYSAYAAQTLLADNALASMGAGLPSAMAAKITYPEKKVVAVVGDGGFMMNSQELETALRLNLDLVIIIVNDSAYGMIKWKQQQMGLAEFAMDYRNPDFIKYAESYGAKGRRVGAASEFAKVLEQALEAKGITVIDLPIDYQENAEVFSKELSKKICP